MNALAACIILMVAMTALVVFSMAVENWTALVQPLRTTAPEEAPAAGTPVEVLLDELDPGETADSGETAAPVETAHPARFVTVAPAPAAGNPDGAVRRTAGSLLVRDGDTADVLAGLLFAAYGASRRAASDRACAWVTAAATPPSLDRDRFPAGVDLRGRPGRMGELLDATDGGVTWLTLRTQVDIARGLRRHPVTQVTVAGLLTWWECTRSLPAVMDAHAAGSLATAIDAVRGRLDAHPWAAVVDEVGRACAGAAAEGTSLLVDLGPEQTAPAQDLGSDGRIGRVGSS